MTDNPLDTDKDRQRRISERAYHLWQSEGELHGHDREYWERAEELIGMEDSVGAGQLPNPMSVPGSDPSRPTMVEEAFIQENLGEFPGQTDQGEHLHTPSAAVTHDQNAATPMAPATGKGRTRKEAPVTAGKAGSSMPVAEKKSKPSAIEEKSVSAGAKSKTAATATRGNKNR